MISTIIENILIGLAIGTVVGLLISILGVLNKIYFHLKYDKTGTK